MRRFTLGKCLICRPTLREADGADHIGSDFHLRCPRCGYHTINHVEGYSSAAPEIERVLRKEWRAGRIARP